MTRILTALVRPAVVNNFKPIVLTRTFAKSSANYDHYDTLGIARNATQNEISLAYKQLVDRYAPEKNKGNTEAYNKYRQVNAAFNILSNYELRRLYNKGKVTKTITPAKIVSHSYTTHIMKMF